MTHAHIFTRRRPTSTVETCRCGRFRFTEHAGESILAAPNIAVYDNGGKTADRYTVIFMDEPDLGGGYEGCYSSLGMSADPFHPQGFCQHGPAKPGRHLGRRIAFEDLPADCQKAVRRDMEGGGE
jgi:hypothetical protein